jgi:hypothetical protein
MKKLNLFFAMILLLPCSYVFPQSSSLSPFQMGTNYISAGTGIGSGSYFNKASYGQSYNQSKTPVFSMSYERGISGLAGIGYIGLAF